MSQQRSMVTFRRQTYSQPQIMQRLRQIPSPRDQYEAQVEVRNAMMRKQETGEQQMAAFYGYVVADRAWIHLDQQTFKEDWAATREVAERGTANRND